MGMLAPPLNLPWAPAFAPSRRRTRTRRPQWRSRSADRARKSSNRQVPPRRDIGRSLKRPVLKDNGGTAHRVPGSERRTPKTARPRRAWKLRRGPQTLEGAYCGNISVRASAFNERNRVTVPAKNRCRLVHCSAVDLGNENPARAQQAGSRNPRS
jgi:hypothetical protein